MNPSTGEPRRTAASSGAAVSSPARWLIGAALGAGLIAALGACEPTVNVHGHMPNEEALAEIKTGATSRDQVRSLLGSPTTVATFDEKRWYYITRKTETASFDDTTLLEQEVLIVDFDDGGFVKDYKLIKGDENNQDVPIVSRETPTKGRELGFFEQILGNFGGNRTSKTTPTQDVLGRSPTRR
jgi:outer membrane protein assembly factor BamE (lipoprotein component of BamABCDE complex)